MVKPEQLRALAAVERERQNRAEEEANGDYEREEAELRKLSSDELLVFYEDVLRSAALHGREETDIFVKDAHAALKLELVAAALEKYGYEVEPDPIIRRRGEGIPQILEGRLTVRWSKVETAPSKDDTTPQPHIEPPPVTATKAPEPAQPQKGKHGNANHNR